MGHLGQLLGCASILAFLTPNAHKPRRFSLMQILTRWNVALMAIVITATAQASTDTWKGGDGYWSDTGKWSLGTVPTADVELSGGGVTSFDSSAEHARWLRSTYGCVTIGAGNQLDIKQG